MISRYRKSVFMVAYGESESKIKYLILKRRFHWRGWEFPKGGVDFPESKKHAVKREIMEETGQKTLKVKEFNFHGKYNYKRKFPDRKDFLGQKFSLYAVEIPYGKIKIDENEHSKYIWLEYEEARKKITFRNQKKCLEIVHDWLTKDKGLFNKKLRK
ncbi:MAG: NUDIX domain-containing protein [Candidatus Pacearchaeota archaeon]